MVDCLPAVELDPPGAASAAVIWLHGLGADGHDFAGAVPDLQLPDSLAVRFVFPHASARPITINRGIPMRAWFDVLEPGQERGIDFEQLRASTAEIHRLIEREIARGIASERVLLVGFSQGGACCIHAALTCPRPLGGLATLSGWFPSAGLIDEVHPANRALPVAVLHGSEDPLLGSWMADSAIAHLQRLGLHPEFHTFAMGHAVCAEELAMLGSFVEAVLGS